MSDLCIACGKIVGGRQHAVSCDVCERWQLRLCGTAISTGIGVYYAVKTRRARGSGSEALLTGGKKLQIVPVTLSLLASFMSAIFILGSPAEVYSESGIYWWISTGNVPAIICTAIFIVPIFYRLKLTSAYGYLEIRFNRNIKLLGSLTFSFQMLLYMAVVLYAPSLALGQVMDISMEFSILVMGLVCTLYTAIGGIKAVIWTDAFQVIIITAGMLALLIKGILEVGSVDEVLERVKEGGRMPYFNPDPDPTVKYTFWTLFVGGAMMTMTIYASNQAMLQRYMSMPSLKHAKISLMLALPGSILYQCLVCILGLVMYAYYHRCDPLMNGQITKRDQMVPLFLLDVLGNIPGLPGLVVACIFSAALSTISSGVNSMAAVALEDFIKPVLKLKFIDPSERCLAIVTVGLAILFGLSSVGLAFVTSIMGKTVLQIAFSIFGMVGGPLLGLIVVGVFFPRINSWGAGIGLLCSLVVCFWIGVGSILKPVSRPKLPFSVVDCALNTALLQNYSTQTIYNVTSDLSDSGHSVDNALNDTLPFLSPFLNKTTETISLSDVLTTDNSSATTTVIPGQGSERSGLDVIYSLSYLHYSTVAVIISVIVGLIVSAITGFNKLDDVDPRTYFHFCSRKPEHHQPTENDKIHKTVEEVIPVTTV